MMGQAGPAVRQLQKIAFDETAPIEARLKATLAIINRTGLGPRSTIDLELTAKPYESIFEQMELGVLRAEHRGEPVTELIEAHGGNEHALAMTSEAADDHDFPLDVSWTPAVEPGGITSQ